MKDYGGALRALRKRMSLTQAQLAEKLNVTYQAVSKWENNINQPDLEALEKICKTFSVTVDEFLRMAERDNLSDEGQPEQKTDDENETTEQSAETEYVVPIGSEPRHVETASAAVGLTAEKKKKEDKKTLIICLSVAVAYVVAMLLTFFIPFGIAKSRKSENEIHTDTDKSMFRIVGRTDDGDLVGSGFFIDKKGTAVTDYRVIEDAKSATARLGGVTYNVDKILGFDASLGLAVIHVDVPSSKPLRNANSDKIKEDDKVYAVYYESIIKSTITSGMVLSPSDERDGVKYVRTTAYVDNDVDYGGGPLVNSKGKVVGVVVGKIKIDGLAYRNLAVPVNAVSDIKRDVNLTLEDYYALRSKKVKITYMLDGEKYATYQVKGVDGHKPPVPTAEFADFDGWYTKADYTVKYTFTGKYDNNIILYGRFLYGKPVLSFDMGGGDGSMSDMLFEEDSVLPECTATYTGYTFEGWKYDKVYAAGEKPNLPSESKRVIFTAVWKPIEYTLNYSYDGEVTTVNLTYDTAHDLLGGIFTRTGYKQTGWKIDGRLYSTKERVKKLTAENGKIITVEPVWTPITFYAEIDLNLINDMWHAVYFDGTRVSYNKLRVSCRYGEDTLNKAHKLTYGSSVLTFESYTVFNDDGSEYEGDFGYVTAEEGKTVKVRANWRSGIYYLELYSGKFSDYFERLKMEGFEEYTLPLYADLCTRGYANISDGYYFKHWVNSASTVVTSYTPVYYTDGQTVSNLLVDGYLVSSDFSVKLYPVASPISYRLVFDNGGGEGVMASAGCTYDKDITLPENTFTKGGYRFAGWKCGDDFYADCAEVKNLTTENGATVTFIAQWLPEYLGEGTESNPYKIGNYAELKNLSQWVGYVVGADSAYYELTADIDCDGGELYPIPRFSGKFDGNGHVILSPVFAPKGGFAGLFAEVRGSIAAVGIEGYSVSAGRGVSAAPLCGLYSSTERLENCYAGGSIVAENAYDNRESFAGLIISADNASKFKNCYAGGSIELKYTVSSGVTYVNDAYVGGFVAVCGMGVRFENCYSDVDITVGDGFGYMRIYSAGFSGSLDSGCNFVNCFTAGDISVGKDSQRNYGFIGLFGADNYYATCENIFVCGTIAVDGESEPIAGNTMGSNQQTTARENLCSLAWLKENLAFDDTVWTQNDGGLPTLAAFARDTEDS